MNRTRSGRSIRAGTGFKSQRREGSNPSAERKSNAHLASHGRMNQRSVPPRGEAMANQRSVRGRVVRQKARISTGDRRGVIARRMVESHQTSAPVTLNTEVDVTALTALFSETFQPSWYVLMARIAAAALAEHPLMNAAWRDGVVLNEGIHIGIAVDTDDGVIVPVIRDVAAKPLQVLAEESKRLVEAARAGKLTLDQLQGGTFTLTNLGMYDIDAFTPIIHLPQCAILGLGRVTPKVVVLDEESGSTDIRRMMSLSLTFDHRVVDGAPAARFLRRIKQLVEEPDEIFKSDNR